MQETTMGTARHLSEEDSQQGCDVMMFYWDPQNIKRNASGLGPPKSSTYEEKLMFLNWDPKKKNCKKIKAVIPQFFLEWNVC